MWSLSDSLITWTSKRGVRLYSITLLAALSSAVLHGTLLASLLPDPERHLRLQVYSALFTGSLVGVTFWFLLRGFSAKRRRVLTYVRQVAELNHQVRNELQVISYGLQLAEHKPILNAMRESIVKIDEALKTIFPLIGEARPSDDLIRELLS